MALNPTVGLKKLIPGVGYLVRIDCAPTSNYATGGEALSFTTAGFPGTKLPLGWMNSSTIAANHVTYIPTGSRDTGKCRFNVAAGTEKTVSAYAGSGQDNFSIFFLFPVQP